MIRIYISIICLASMLHACQQKTDDTAVSITISPEDLIGKTIEYRYGESVYHVTIDSDSTMHWEAMAGDEKGTSEEETYTIESIDSARLFISWGEKNGTGVSQVLDFENGMVYNHLVRGRVASRGQGNIKILSR